VHPDIAINTAAMNFIFMVLIPSVIRVILDNAVRVFQHQEAWRFASFEWLE
jgi:hypothetical protein